MILANNATVILTKDAIEKILLDNQIFQLNRPKFIIVKDDDDLEKIQKMLPRRAVSILRV